MNESARENLTEAIELLYEATDLLESDTTIPHDSRVYNTNRIITAILKIKDVLADE